MNLIFTQGVGLNNHRDVKGGITLYIEPTLLPKFTNEAPIKFDFAVCDSLNLVESTYFVAVKCGTVLVHVMVVVESVTKRSSVYECRSMSGKLSQVSYLVCVTVR